MVFWAGLIGVVVGAVVGVFQKRRAQPQAPLVAAAAAASAFVIVTIVWALAS